MARRTTTPPPPEEFEEKIVGIDVEEEMQKAFLEYSYSVIYSRALPDARDGLKPVQRRILYGANELGLRPDRGHVKSQRVVGEVMGKYHPHGDQAIYDALVRMAQPFTLRLPLIDGHGNFGSLDDGPAAARYTEARMADAALLMVGGLDEDTVDFVPNYDDTQFQPGVLPAAYPNLLVNGASGIAVGMATNMPPHNLVEVIGAARHLIANPGCSLEDLMNFVPGPDLPCGGKIVGLEGIRDAYLTGRGSFRTRATARIESLTPRRKGIIVTELPYLVGPEKVVDNVTDLVRYGRLQGVSSISNLSDRQHGLRLVIEVKNGFNPDVVLEQLYKLTPMEENFGINNVALVEGQPRTMGLKELLRVYVDFRTDVVRRRTAHRLAMREEALHLVEGLLIAILGIDEVIQVIRSSDDAATARGRLMEVFDLSEVQATYILDQQLRRLTRVTVRELKAERRRLEGSIGELRTLLVSERLLHELVSTEFADVANALGTSRRMMLLDSSGAILSASTIPDAGSSLGIAQPAQSRPSVRPQLAPGTPEQRSRQEGPVDIPEQLSGTPTPADVFGGRSGEPSSSGGRFVDQTAATAPRQVQRTDAVDPADKMWNDIQLAHPRASPLGHRGRLPRSGVFSEPGALFTHMSDTKQIVVALARNLAVAASAMETTSDAVLTRSRALWVPGSEDQIRSESPILRAPKSALQQGRPLKVNGPADWTRVPHVAGIYRIHLFIRGEAWIYVGRSRDLRVRPFRHEKTTAREWGGFPEGVRCIELIPVKGHKQLDLWTVTDLDEAEERHISRARDREIKEGGPRVINVTVGRNGPPSKPPSRVLVWTAEEQQSVVS